MTFNTFNFHNRIDRRDAKSAAKSAAHHRVDAQAKRSASRSEAAESHRHAQA
jgi:hypothetical protein